MRLRLKSRQNGPTKFQSEWSDSHEVLSVIGVVVTLRELSTGREYVTHHDRLSNPLLSGKETESREIESNANLRENEKEPEADQLPVGNPEEALMRTRVGRIVKPPRNPDFEYSFLLPSSISESTSQVATSTISHVSKHCSVSSTTTSTASVHNLSAFVSHSQEDKIRFEQRDRIESLGEQTYLDSTLQTTLPVFAAAPQSRTLHQPMSLMPSAPWLTPTPQTNASGATTRSPPKLKIAAKSTGPDTSTTAPSLTTCLAQPLLALLAGAASTSPMPPAS